MWFDRKALQYIITCHFISKINGSSNPMQQGILSDTVQLISVRNEKLLLTMLQILCMLQIVV